MPTPQNYDILLNLTNDAHDVVSVQLLADYGRNPNNAALLKPTETLTLVLESGASYQYAVKLHTRVVNVTARSWGDFQCHISQLFMGNSNRLPSATNMLIVDRIWRDNRFDIWADEE